MPNLKVGYYLPKAVVAALVTQTAACTTDNVPIVATDVKWESAYWRDRSRAFQVDLSQLGSGMTKGDATLEFYSDGRLKSVNSTQTGQGQAVLLGALKLAMVSAPVHISAIETQPVACDALRKFAGEAKVLTILRRGNTEFSEGSQSFDVPQFSMGESQFNLVRPIFGEVTGSFAKTYDGKPLHELAADYTGPTITLAQPAEVAAAITLSLNGQAGKTWSTDVLVPQLGSEYQLPLQKSPWFGENIVELALDPSGIVTKLRYSGNADVAGALDVATGIRGATDSETAAEKAERLKAEGDVIFQQQRLVLCRADPLNCPI